ncbi:MAG TPA: DUF748 domain-containing protein, partial [Opitutus sp.]|nr:DUF748 domain-containing protein [Opitutus sp.]
MTYRNRRRVRTLVILVALYAIVGFFVLPLIIKRQIERRLSAQLERPVRVGSVRVNPFVLSVAVGQVDVRTPDDHATMAGWDRLYFNFDAIGSISGDWVFDDVELDGFRTAIEVKPDGSLNFSDLIQKFRQPTVDTTPSAEVGRPWRINRLRVAQAQVDFTDRSRTEEFHTTVGPINFTLLGFRTAGKKGAPYRFNATTDAGETFSWDGTLTAAPFTSAGEWRIDHLKLASYSPYFDRRLNARVTAGELTLSGDYDANFAPDHRQFRVSHGAASIKDLRLLPRSGDDPLLVLAAAEVTGITGDLLVPKISIDAVHLNGGHFAAARDPTGAIDLLAAFSGAKGAAAGPAGAAGAAPFDLSVHEIALRDFDGKLRDTSGSRPVEFNVTRLNATLKDFSLASGAAVPVDLTLGLAPQGTLHASGSFTVEPLQADLDLELGWLAIPPLSPYLERTLAARIERGTGSLQGHLKLARTGNGGLNVAFRGGGRLDDFALADGAHNNFAGFSQLAANGVQVATAPKFSLSIREVKLDSPYTRAVVDRDGKLNLAGLAAANNAATTPAAIAPAGPQASGDESDSSRPDISVDQLTLAGGDFSFADQSVDPAAEIRVAQTSAEVRNLSLAEANQSAVELHALIDGRSPLSLRGRIGMLGTNFFADLTLDSEPADLKSLAPYIAKYAGYQLAQGSVKLEARANVAARKIDAHDTVTLSDFALGAPSNSPDAVKAPVRLAVALLKDRSGNIVLHVPVQGSLADPNFHFGAAAGHVFTNLLAKAATSPFALLGSMFGGGGEELARQDFAPGQAEPTGESARRLATVRRALAERPALKIEIEGGYSAGADAAALKRTKLDDLVRERFRQDHRHAPPAGAIELTADERRATLAQMFAEKFP